MSDKIVKLLDHKPDSKRWTPMDALKAAVADIESGEIKPTQLIVLYVEDTEDRRIRVSQYVANMSTADHIAFLTMKIHEAIDDWRS